jgi:hypothetical protein
MFKTADEVVGVREDPALKELHDRLLAAGTVATRLEGEQWRMRRLLKWDLVADGGRDRPPSDAEIDEARTHLRAGLGITDPWFFHLPEAKEARQVVQTLEQEYAQLLESKRDAIRAQRRQVAKSLFREASKQARTLSAAAQACLDWAEQTRQQLDMNIPETDAWREIHTRIEMVLYLIQEAERKE